MFEKYEDESYITESSEKFNQLAKDMATVEMGDAGKAGQMVKDATKQLGLDSMEKKGLKKIPLFAKVSNRANAVLIDTMSAEQVLVKYEKELLEEETKAKLSKTAIKNGIARNKQIITEVEEKLVEVKSDIDKLNTMQANGEALVEDVPGTLMNRLQSYSITLEQQKADAMSRTLQYSVQLVLAENILTGFNDVRLSVTTTLRDSILQAQIIHQQEQYIKTVKDAKEVVRNVKVDNANRLKQMAANASSDIYQYEEDAEAIKSITDINYATITSIKELNESVEKGRELLRSTFVDIEHQAEENYNLFKTITEVSNSGDDEKKQQLIANSEVK